MEHGNELLCAFVAPSAALSLVELVCSHAAAATHTAMGLATAHQIQYHLWFSLSACDWSVVTAAPPAPPAKSSLFSKAHAHLKGSKAGI